MFSKQNYNFQTWHVYLKVVLLILLWVTSHRRSWHWQTVSMALSSDPDIQPSLAVVPPSIVCGSRLVLMLLCSPVCITATVVCVPLHPKRCLSHSADARSPAWEGRCVFSDVHHFKQSMRIVLVTKVMFSLLIRKWELGAGISFHRCLRSVHNQLPHQTQSGTHIRWNLRGREMFSQYHSS